MMWRLVYKNGFSQVATVGTVLWQLVCLCVGMWFVVLNSLKCSNQSHLSHFTCSNLKQSKHLSDLRPLFAFWINFINMAVMLSDKLRCYSWNLSRNQSLVYYSQAPGIANKSRRFSLGLPRWPRGWLDCGSRDPGSKFPAYPVWVLWWQGGKRWSRTSSAHVGVGSTH